MPSIKVAFGDKENPKTIEVEGKKGKKEKKVPKRLEIALAAMPKYAVAARTRLAEIATELEAL